MPDDRKQLLIRIDPEVKKELKKKLIDREMSMQEFFDFALHKLLGIHPVRKKEVDS